MSSWHGGRWAWGRAGRTASGPAVLEAELRPLEVLPPVRGSQHLTNPVYPKQDTNSILTENIKPESHFLPLIPILISAFYWFSCPEISFFLILLWGRRNGLTSLVLLSVSKAFYPHALARERLYFVLFISLLLCPKYKA